MNQRDHLKLIKDGYTIIHCPNEQPVIKYAVPTTEGCTYYTWKTYRKFKTKAARDRFAQEMLQDDKCIED